MTARIDPTLWQRFLDACYDQAVDPSEQITFLVADWIAALDKIDAEANA